MNLYELHCEALKKIENPYYRGGLAIIVEMWSEKLKKNQKITVNDVEKYYDFEGFYKILKEDGMLVYIDRHDNDDKLGFYVEDYLMDDDINPITYQFFSVIYDLDKMRLLDIENNILPESSIKC